MWGSDEDIELFLSDVLPNDGVFAVNTLSFSGGIKGKFSTNWVNSIEAVGKVVHGVNRFPANIYVGLAGFKEKSRVRENATCAKIFVLDLDVGNLKYSNKKSALRSLFEFLSETNIARPKYILDTGMGIHAYWTLTETIPIEEWNALANGLRECLKDYGLMFDDIIRDPTKGIRVPTTFNYKSEPPAEVKMLKVWDSVSAEDLRAQLKDWIAVAIPTGNIPLALVADTSLEDGVNMEYRKLLFADVMPQCVLFKNLVDNNGATADYQLWLRVLQFLSVCEDGEEYVHTISKGHPEYREALTDKKFEEISKRGYKPILCDTFESASAQSGHCDDCSNCPLKGKIKSPASIHPIDPLHIPFPYTMVEDKGIVLRGDAELDTPPKLVFPYLITEVELLALDSNRADGLLMGATIPKKGIPHTSYIPFTTVTDSRALSTLLSSKGWMLNGVQLRDMGNFMTSWIRELQREIAPKKAVRTFGWHKDKDGTGFVLGDRLYNSDGTSLEVPVIDSALISQYTPHGEFSEWKKAGDFIINQGRGEFVATLAAGFAAPLIRYTGISGALVSLVGALSGTGKSSCLRTAQAIWGDPKLGINALNDTTNSVTVKVGMLNNLPVFWDEIRVKEDVADFLRMAFSLGQGKSKSRLTANSDLKHVYSWDTLMVCASNESIVEHVYSTVKDSDAGVLRVFELAVTDTSSNDNVGEMMTMFKALDDNYGHAGKKYIEYLVNNQPKVEAIIKSISDKLASEVNVSANERFWFSTVVSLLASAAIAKTAGLLNFNLATLKEYLLKRLKVMRSIRVTEKRLETDSLSEYLNDTMDGKLWTDTINTGGRGKPTKLIMVDPMLKPTRGITYHLGEESNSLMIPVEKLKEWCIKKGISYNNLRDALVVAHGAQVRRFSLGAGTMYQVGRVYCIYISDYNPITGGNNP